MAQAEGAGNTDIITILNELIETCKDGEQGFRAASDGVPNIELTSVFLTYSEQRAGFAAELLAEVRRIGGDPGPGGAQGDLRRGWTGIKAAVEGKNEVAIISEAERSEDHAVQEYCEALKKNLPTAVQAIVENHYIHVRDAHEHVRALERVHQEKFAAPKVETPDSVLEK